MTPLKPPPTSFLNAYGLVRDIADWIDKVSPYQCRPLSVTTALAILCTLCGRRYALPGGGRAVGYFVGVAESGIGKEAGRQAAIRLLARAGLERRVGAGDFASETGMVVQLREMPVRLFPLDEFGRMLAAYSHKNAGTHERQIMTTLMKLWSSAGCSTFLGKTYAEKPAIKIEEPHAVLYGTTTPAAFWRAIQGQDIVDGVLSRLLIVPVDGDRGVWRKPSDADTEPPATLVEACKAIAAGPPMGDLSHIDDHERPGVHCTVALSEIAQEAADRVRLTADKLALKSPMKDLWRRAHEQTMRLALAMAVGAWSQQGAGCLVAGLPLPASPMVSEGDIVWAWRLVRWSTERMVDSVAELVADSEEERAQLAILKAIKAEPDGAGKNSITRAAQRFPLRVREAALTTLLDGEQVVKESRLSRGRTAAWYRLATSSDDTDNLGLMAAE